MKYINGIVIGWLWSVMSVQLHAAASPYAISEEAARTRCQQFGCELVRRDFLIDSNFIVARPVAQEPWETEDAFEAHHVTYRDGIRQAYCSREMCNAYDAAVVQGESPEAAHRNAFTHVYVTPFENNRGVCRHIDMYRADIVFDRYVEIFNQSKEAKFFTATKPEGQVIPVIVEPLLGLVDRRFNVVCEGGCQDRECKFKKTDDTRWNGRIYSVGRATACNRIKQEIAIELFAIFKKKNTAFEGSLIRAWADNMIAKIDSSNSANSSSPGVTDDSTEVIMHEQGRPPRTFNGSRPGVWWGGFFAGLGWTGLSWAAVYLLRSCRENIRMVARLGLPAASCLPFFYALRVHAQPDSNPNFWRGVLCGSTTSQVALFVAHKTGSLQKLLAAASRQR